MRKEEPWTSLLYLKLAYLHAAHVIDLGKQQSAHALALPGFPMKMLLLCVTTC